MAICIDIISIAKHFAFNFILLIGLKRYFSLVHIEGAQGFISDEITTLILPLISLLAITKAVW